MTFNNVDLYEEFGSDEYGESYFLVNNVTGRGVMDVEAEGITATQMDGVYPSFSRYKERILGVDFTLKGEDFEDLRKKLERLNEIFSTRGEEVPIEFDDEPNRVYRGRLTSAEDSMENGRIYQASITITCGNPHKRGKEPFEDTFEDYSFVVENKGMALAKPVFELTAREKTTFAMVSNGTDENSSYNIIGVPTEVDEEVVDTRKQVFVEYGETLGEWNESGSEFDNGKVTGDQLGFDGTGIHPLSYGDPGGWDKWYGPARMREITPIQDFEVEMRLRVNTNNPNELYRIEFYLYDENMVEIGKMAIRDFSKTVQRYAAEGRVGEFKGAGKNYLISQENYLREGSHFHGLVRMRRVGDEFEFYAARLKTGDNEYGKHHDIIKIPFKDTENKYQGKLRYVQINIARHAQGTRASVPRINSIRVNELSEEVEDSTPYIIYPGD